MDLQTSNRKSKTLIFFCLGLLISIFSRCMTYYEEGFSQDKRKRYVFEEFYDKNDTLLLHHFTVYGFERTRESYETKYFPYQCNSDSIFESFRNSLLSLDVAIETTNYGLNKALDTSSVFLLKHTKTNSYSILSSKEWIKNFLEFTLDYPDQSIIIPFVWITFGICDTHRCAYNGSYYSLSLGLMIYVIRNNRVVYQKSLSRFTELDGKFQTIDYQACDVRIDSNLIDKLVKQVMIDYTNRLK